jgi:large subunit ribosomal protein L5
MAALKDRYRRDIAPELMKALGCRNLMEVPRLLKVTVNMGFNSTLDKDTVKAVAEDLARITGQRPVVTKARKSISNFKLRKGMPVGAKVNLRGHRMYEFLERLIHAALPRIRDFRGLPVGGFDGRGSYTFGLQEQTVFPEIDPDEVKRVQGMNVTIVTSATSDERARELLARLGIPFAKASR